MTILQQVFTESDNKSSIRGVKPVYRIFHALFFHIFIQKIPVLGVKEILYHRYAPLSEKSGASSRLIFPSTPKAGLY